MNKKIPTMLLVTALALTLAGAAYAEESPASAAPTDATASETQAEEVVPAFYPTDIELRQDGEQTLIVKHYTVPADTQVSDLKESDLTRMGSDYTLWGVSKTQENTKIEEAELSKTLDVAVPSNIPEEAVAALQQDVLYDQDGYFGTLHLVNVTCTDEMREDGSYPATANYTGTVSRVTEGDLVVELIYAPVAAAPVENSSVPGIPAAGILVGSVALLGGAGFAGYCIGKRRSPAEAVPAETEEKPKVYVPANDIVVGAREEDDEDE